MHGCMVFTITKNKQCTLEQKKAKRDNREADSKTEKQTNDKSTTGENRHNEKLTTALQWQANNMYYNDMTAGREAIVLQACYNVML